MKSPLKEKPERLPGQSQDEYLNDFIDEKLSFPFVIVGMVVALIIMEWVHFFVPSSPHPVIFSLIGILGILFIARSIKRDRNKAFKLKQGRDGERTVGQHLEELRSIGCSVLHDIQGEKFNLDHVVVCRQGIFTVETKTWSKNNSMETIKFDGTNIIGNGYKNSHPITQSLAQSNWLRSLLRESTGKDFHVKPAIMFPGWYVDPKSTKLAATKGIFLLNPKAFSEFIKKMPSVLEDDDVNLVTMHLKSYSRSKI